MKTADGRLFQSVSSFPFSDPLRVQDPVAGSGSDAVGRGLSLKDSVYIGNTSSKPPADAQFFFNGLQHYSIVCGCVT